MYTEVLHLLICMTVLKMNMESPCSSPSLVPTLTIQRPIRKTSFARPAITCSIGKKYMSTQQDLGKQKTLLAVLLSSLPMDGGKPVKPLTLMYTTQMHPGQTGVINATMLKEKTT